MLTTTSTSMPVHPLYPKDMDSLLKLSETLSKSDMIPKAYLGKPGNIVISLLTGLPLGLSPLMSLKYITPINGTPTIWGDALLGLVQSSKLLEFIEESGDSKKATCVLKRKNQLELKRTFTIEEAKQANLLGKDNWQKYPARMLQLRARAFALRDAFADFLLGLSIREEIEDSPTQNTDASSFNPIENLKEKLSDTLPPEAVAEVIEETPEISLFEKAEDLYASGKSEQLWGEELLEKMFFKYSVTSFEEMSESEIKKCIQHMEKKLNVYYNQQSDAS